MSNTEYLQNLIELGLNSYEAKVYLSILGKNSVTASVASKMSGVPRQRIYDILNSLQTKGLCHEKPGKVLKYKASEPKKALISMLVDKNNKFQKQLEIQRELALKISKNLENGNKIEENEPMEFIEVYRNPNQILRKYDEMLLEAENEILNTAKLPYLQEKAEPTYEKVKNGIDVKFLIENNILKEKPKLIEAIFRLYGEKENRFIDSVPLKFTVFDGKKVSLTLPSENTNGIVGVVIKNKNMAEAMRLLFYSLWENGVQSDMKIDEIENSIKEATK